MSDLKCDKCEEALTAGEFATCLGGCQKNFHYECSIQKTDWVRKSLAMRKKWKCEMCMEPKPRKDTNEENEEEINKNKKEKEKKINSDKKNEEKETKQQNNTNEDDIREMKLLLFKMDQKINMLLETREQVQELCQSVEYLNREVEDIRKENEEMKNEIKELKTENEKIKEEVKTMNKMKEDVNIMKIEQYEQEQYMRNKNIEIANVDVCQNEDIVDTIERIAKQFNISHDLKEVEKAHRVPTRNPNKTPNIVIQFKTREDRDKWIKSRKKTTTNDDCFKNGNGRKIFINEHMTQYNKNLFWKTKEYARQNQIKFVWFREGKVRMKKDESQKIIQIVRSESDLP